jgi:hypothetical protein
MSEQGARETLAEPARGPVGRGRGQAGEGGGGKGYAGKK